MAREAREQQESAQHTPGPWNPVYRGTRLGWGVDGGGQDQYVVASINGQTLGELVANTRLIAAAPELLAALKDATDTLEMLYHPKDIHRHAYKVELLERARGAIHKATEPDPRQRAAASPEGTAP